jgi:hypothetical protein
MTQLTIYKKIVALERKVQKIKLEAYRALPKTQRPLSVYPEKTLARAVRDVRKKIWRRDYAKKIKSLS